MKRRKLVIALAAAALFGVLVVPASAELHRVNVTLVTGEVRTMTVDVPPGQTVESIEIPGLPAPVKSVEDLGPVATPTPVPEPTATPTVPSTPVTPTPTPTPTPEQPSQQQPSQQQQQPQQGGGSQGGSAPQPTAPTQGGGNTSRGRIVGDDRAAADPNSESLTGALDEITQGADKQVDRSNPTRNTDGSPTLDNPTVSLATPGPARIGVPNFFIDKFRIPPFLLPIYQAAGIEYGVRWEVLAAINEIETDYGRNLNVSSAGALGWMQFMPATWELYGVDGNHDGLKDPYNPVDAIFAAARYLKAAGADTDLRAAIFAYNHADWYVDSVILRARYIGGLPADLVGSLSGLTQGRFPVQAKAAYAKEVKRNDVKAAKEGRNPAYVVESDSQRKGIKVFARSGAPVVAVNDGRIVKVGQNRKLGNFVVLQDVYGNTYTYAHLKDVVEKYPTPTPRKLDKDAVARELSLPARDAAPTGPASVTTATEAKARKASKTRAAAKTPRRPAQSAPAAAKERLFANPDRPNASAAGGEQQLYEHSESFGSYLNRVFGLDRSDVDMKRLKRGAHVTSGTVLGHVGKVAPRSAPHLLFQIRPAGRGAPRIDPKPILDGWKLLESTAIYRAAGRNPFVGKDAETPSIGQILLMSKDALAQRVLADPNVQLYDCGRQDVRAGQIDRRVLATLEFLVASGLKPTVTSLKCGHSYLTASGNVSEHTTGTAVDIAAINGVPILGNQGAGSITELTIRRLLTLQGTMKPHQIISLMTFEDADNTIAMSDHADHIHVGFRPLYGVNAKTARQVDAMLEPDQWIKLIERLDEIDNPNVSRKPSKYAVDADRRASPAHKGE
jgi:murein DD-endopeptidase MepM/ murein hydrolase activator NlpD/outer membrane biosynthesis protein TonB